MDATENQMKFIMDLRAKLGVPVAHVNDLPSYNSIEASIEINNLKADLKQKKKRA